MTAAHAARYFTEKMNVPEEKIFDGLNFSMSYLKDPGNWLTNEQARGFFYNCHHCSENFTHNAWKDVGREMLSNSAQGYFKMLFMLMNMETIYKNMPEYINRLFKWCSFEIIEEKKGEVVFLCRTKDKASRDDYYIGSECRYNSGVIASIPNVKNNLEYESDAVHEICSMQLPVILENCYGFDSMQYHYDSKGFHIKGELSGRWIKLKNREYNEKYLSGNYSLCPENEADAVVISRDIIHNKIKIFSEGEIYDAPYCIIKATYKKRLFAGEKPDNKKFLVFLENQLKLAEEKFVQASNAKKELEDTLKEVVKRDEIISIYIRNSIYREIANGKNPLEFKPVRKSAAIMFTDLRNFASITEKFDAITITAFLNEYFSMMSAPISKNNGEIDKFMGDAIMAVFDKSTDAVRAAVEMIKLLHTERDKMLPGMGFEFRMGVGINFDEIVEGNIGTPDTKMDRTIIGDGVNLASRLESLTKFYRTEIIVSDSVLNQLGKEFKTRYLDLITVKGKMRPVAIYEVLTGQSEEQMEFKNNSLYEYMQAIELYKSGDFSGALRIFMSLNSNSDKYGNANPYMDPIIGIYVNRLQKLIEHADDSTFTGPWDGVYRHDEK
jgi:class 3 adenylate cyclase